MVLDRSRFLFVGNHVALDFINTRPAPDGEPAELLPDLESLLEWFLAAGLLAPHKIRTLARDWAGVRQAEAAVCAIRELRETLRHDLTAWENGRTIRRSTIAELNRLMAEHPMLARLSASGEMLTLDSYFDVRQPEDLFAPLASEAAKFFATADRQKVRQCEACVLHFQDTSRKGSRRWCSMQLCGNRLKVAAYAARHRDERST